MFAVTGVTRAGAMVLDIQNGYFDRLMTTPVSRRALLLGHMVADFVLVIALSVPVMILGFFMGARFDTGPLGVLVFVLIGALWGLGYTGIPYAIALKTGNPGAVNSSFIIFFPFAFLTTAYLPAENLSGWLSIVSTYNPVTYVRGLRSLFIGWDAAEWARRCSRPSPSQHSPRRSRCSPSRSDVAEASVPRCGTRSGSMPMGVAKARTHAS